MEEIEILRAKSEPVWAFGKVYPAEQWAKMLNMSFNLFTYLRKDCRKTVEEIYQLQGILFSEPKKGAKMQDIMRRMSVILHQSGYDDLTGLGVESVPGSPSHRVILDGETVGRYFYNEDRLALSCGDEVTHVSENLKNITVWPTSLGWRLTPRAAGGIPDQFRHRAKRRGKWMDEAEARVKTILILSGYDPSGLKLGTISKSPSYLVTLDGETVGRYFYKDGRLVMENGEGVRLTDLEEGELKIQRVGGVWRLHPDTKLAIINNAARRGRAGK